MFRYLFLLIIISCTAFGQSYDAFGRLRTSGPGQRLDVEFLYDKQPDYFDELTNNGTVTHNADSRDLTLSLTGGHILTSEYIYATSSGPSSSRFTASGSRVLGKVPLWNRLSSESGILTIAAIRTSGSDASCLASLNWIEIR